ncbi:unnamed protein product [Paramecium pentaurelia]|uniref:Uncharacterized protein n=1 Tax=Paramecium pentaurelia TaxID=43138 RepID=A0A8S1Y901_9CILI|nr:unnamed protein product [Paramecium pentaurelia]
MKQQLSLLNLTNNQPNTKASIINRTQDLKKKMSSFDVLGKSPYKSNFNRQNSRHLLKEYQPITTRVNQRQSIKSPPESTKSSKPISISNNMNYYIFIAPKSWSIHQIKSFSKE